MDSLSLREFLSVLRERGREKQAENLEQLVLNALKPALEEEEVYKMTLREIASALRITSLISSLLNRASTVTNRMDELRAEGWDVTPGIEYVDSYG